MRSLLTLTPEELKELRSRARLQCINNDDQESILVTGKVYEFDKLDTTRGNGDIRIMIINKPGFYFKLRRFKLVGAINYKGLRSNFETRRCK
jgi:hypothetical protein